MAVKKKGSSTQTVNKTMGGRTQGGGSAYKDDNGDKDYSALISDAMKNGASADTVQGLLDQRVDKALGSGLDQYAYDDFYGSAMDYINGQKQQSRPSYSAPSSPGPYKPSRQSEIDDLLDEILNRKDFSYDPTTDPLYAQYSQQYQREGQRATEDTLADVAAQTGGMSSYAVTAAGQAGNYYAAKQADMIPQLYQAAYEKYLADIDGKVRDLGLLNDMDQTQYNRYRDTMSDWRNDRDFAYGMYRDQVGDQHWDQEFDYNAGRDKVNDNRYDNEWNHQLDQEQYAKDKETALTLAAAGSFYALAQLWGLDEEQTQTLVDEYARQRSLSDTQAARDLADWYAQYGDFGRLKQQGVDTSFLEKQQQQALTPKPSGGGGGGGGGNGGGNGGGAGDADVYAGMYAAGIRSEGDAYAYLLTQGYNTTQAGKLAGYFTGWMADGAGAGGVDADRPISDQVTNSTDAEGSHWINVPGFGRLTWQELESLVNRGAIVEYYDAATGKYTYKKNPDKKG